MEQYQKHILPVKQISYFAIYWKMGSPRKFIMSMIFALMFSDINFSNYDNDYSSDPANESLQFSYKWSK